MDVGEERGGELLQAGQQVPRRHRSHADLPRQGAQIERDHTELASVRVPETQERQGLICFYYKFFGFGFKLVFSKLFS